MSPTGRSPTGDLPADDGWLASNYRLAAGSRPVGHIPKAGCTLLALDRTVNDTWDPRGMHGIPGGRFSDSNFRHLERQARVGPTTVWTPTATPQYKDEMSCSHTGQPASHPGADGRDFLPLEDMSAETLQRKRKRETMKEQVTQPDDRPLKKKRLMDPSLTPQHPPEPVSAPAPLKDTTIRQAEGVNYECPRNVLGHPNPSQGIPDVLEPPKKKRKRTQDVEPGPTKKRKKVDNSQNGATDGGLLDVKGDITNGSYQGSVWSTVDPPLPSRTVAPPEPWTPPVPTESDKEAGVQVLEPAPPSRFTSGGGLSKKDRSSVWHVWSEVRNCARKQPG